MVTSRKERNSSSIEVLALVFASFLPGMLYSQTDSLKHRVKEAIGKTLVHDYFGCERRDNNFSFSSIVLLFSKKGTVEGVLFSQLPDCFSGIQPKLEGDLKANIKNLGLPKREFSNKLVLVILTKKSVSQPPAQKINFEGVFNDIDEKILRSKEVKYLLSITINELIHTR